MNNRSRLLACLSINCEVMTAFVGHIFKKNKYGVWGASGISGR